MGNGRQLYTGFEQLCVRILYVSENHNGLYKNISIHPHLYCTIVINYYCNKLRKWLRRYGKTDKMQKNMCRGMNSF